MMSLQARIVTRKVAVVNRTKSQAAAKLLRLKAARRVPRRIALGVPPYGQFQAARSM